MIDVDVSPPTASRAEAKNNTLMLTVDVDDISHHGNHTITTPSLALGFVGEGQTEGTSRDIDSTGRYSRFTTQH